MKKVILSIILAFSCSVLFAGDAKSEAPKKQCKKGKFVKGAKGDHAGDRKAAFLAKFDTNKDGKICEEERKAVRAAFAEKRGDRTGKAGAVSGERKGKCKGKKCNKGDKKPSDKAPEGSI